MPRSLLCGLARDVGLIYDEFVELLQVNEIRGEIDPAVEL
jgi:hypothetical protein